jgi:hypothetical protein
VALETLEIGVPRLREPLPRMFFRENARFMAGRFHGRRILGDFDRPPRGATHRDERSDGEAFAARLRNIPLTPGSQAVARKSMVEKSIAGSV